ncbi:uncharacterized protein LOC131663927 isoform X2 [Phymastichus coffea]|uniref:uncharacterized protein LOC131663927 isoform X2 n=1 Tax=Phymastichus coffea TaxID=108790 RepID=UPI00273AA24B|nr:uncharacterized protein LOC131663927 isoform X2 [Phymastichus coffea]
MADASSSDTTSDCSSEYFSDISSEKSTEYVVDSQRISLINRRVERNFLQKLLSRETRGSLTQHNYAPEERLFTTIPSWRHLSLLQIFPKSALQAGHIVMGLTQCGRFLLSYTYTIDVGTPGSYFKYFLHWWAFTPTKVARKVAEVTLFGNYSISKELSIVIAQWPTERNKLVIHGLCSSFQSQSQQTDKAYVTITTVPSLSNCADCQVIASSYEEEDLAASWDTCVRCNCLQHGLTVHTTYEVISPYPKFRAVVCLNYANHIVVNSGNFLHVLRVDLENIKLKNQRSIERQDSSAIGIEQLDISVHEVGTSKAENYDSLDDKGLTPESMSVVSPKCETALTEYDFNDESQCKVDNDSIQNTSCSSNQSYSVCDNIKSSNYEKSCHCIELQCQCNNHHQSEPQAISVRDKILQDFCEDMSQELSISSDIIALVKHPPCSPRSTPQRIPLDLKPFTWSSPVLTPPSDILKTRNSDSSHRNSPQPGASQGNVAPGSPRLMSPPITRSFRHSTSRKRANIISPQPRTRASHKVSLEAEKAYEFTDDAQETCEKLSSFRKRRLADKKYEFCDETEDAENIVPFKHIRDQSKLRGCTIYQISPVASPLPNGRRHRLDSEHSESDELNGQDHVHSDISILEMTEKNVLRPLNQNQLPNLCRERTNKPCVNNVTPVVPKANLQYPIIKCTSHFKRSYIDLDDERTSVITDVEDEETGCYASYQCVLPMQVHGADYAQMGMISNAKAEKLNIPFVAIHQMSFDIETFSHHIADWQCKLFKKKYWHCSDYDIEIIDICALSGDVTLLLIMKIQTSEQSSQGINDRKQYVAGCKFTWNVDTNLYHIMAILKMKEVKPDPIRMEKSSIECSTVSWNPTKLIASQMREKIQQPYARRIRYLSNELTLSDESITRLKDFDNLIEIYITPLPNCS